MVDCCFKFRIILVGIVVVGYVLSNRCFGEDSENPSIFYVNRPTSTSPDKQQGNPIAVRPSSSNAAVASSTSGLSGSPEVIDSPSGKDPALSGSLVTVPAPADSLETKTVIQKSRSAQPSGESNTEKVVIPGGAPSLWRTLGALAAVLGLILLGTWLWRRLTPGSNRLGHCEIMKVLARNAINPKQSLCLVKVGSRLLVLGVSPNHMAAVDTIDDPEEIAMILGQIEQSTPQSVSNTFTQLFSRQANDYSDMDIDGEIVVDDLERSSNAKWSHAMGELSSLLTKVKGLTRMHLRSGSKN